MAQAEEEGERFRLRWGNNQINIFCRGHWRSSTLLCDARSQMNVWSVKAVQGICGVGFWPCKM